MQMRRNRHPAARISATSSLTHLPNPLTAYHCRTCNTDLRQMRVQREKLLPTPRPNMLYDNVPAEVRQVLVLHNFRNASIEHAKHVIMRHEGRLFAFKIAVRGAIRKDDQRLLSRRRNLDRRNVTPAMKPLPAVARPSRFPIISIHARAREKLLRRIKQKMVRRRPRNSQGRVARQRKELVMDGVVQEASGRGVLP